MSVRIESKVGGRGAGSKRMKETRITWKRNWIPARRVQGGRRKTYAWQICTGRCDDFLFRTLDFSRICRGTARRYKCKDGNAELLVMMGVRSWEYRMLVLRTGELPWLCGGIRPEVVESTSWRRGQKFTNASDRTHSG
jgi:hypothetical protein